MFVVRGFERDPYWDCEVKDVYLFYLLNFYRGIVNAKYEVRSSENYGEETNVKEEGRGGSMGL